TVTGTLPESVPLDQGVLVALEAILSVYRSPSLPDQPPLHGGVVGYLGYEVVREVERLPNAPADDQGYPDAILTVIGDMAAYDHWRQRVTVIANVVVDHEMSEAELDEAYDAAAARVERLANDGSRPLDEPVVEPPDEGEPLAEVHRVVSA